jgi:hypothetical protein
MRLAMLADDALDIVAHHPVLAALCAVAAALLSLMVTTARSRS